MTQIFLTDEQRVQLLANGRARAEDPNSDPQPVVMFFTPDAHATWVVAALDPQDEDLAHGLIDLGLGTPEAGDMRLSMLAGIRGPRGLAVLRDLHFVGKHPLSEYVRMAIENGSFIE